MNKAEFVSHVAAETSTTRATAEWMDGADFCAIADVLARDEPLAIAGFGKFAPRSRAAPQRRNPPIRATGCRTGFQDRLTAALGLYCPFNLTSRCLKRVAYSFGTRCVISALFCFVVTACATPDLSGYADQSTKLAALTRSELAETTVAVKAIAEYVEGETAEGETAERKIAPSQEETAASAKVVNATLTAMVNYSEALKSLSESGEGGAEAAETAIGHLKTLSDLLGGPNGITTLGLSSKLLETVKTATSRISQFVQAQQANTVLREVTADAQPAVEGMRDILVAVFSYCKDQGMPPCNAKTGGAARSSGTATEPEGWWSAIIGGAVTVRTNSAERAIGDNVIGLAELLKKHRNDLYGRYKLAFDTAANLPEFPMEDEHGQSRFCVSKDPVKSKCIDPDLLETIERLDARWFALAPDLERYNDQVYSAKTWQEQRFLNGAKIVQAAIVWASEHAKVVAALQECQFAVFSCRSVDASELASILVDTINNEN